MKKNVLAAFLLFSVISCESDDNKSTDGGSGTTPTNIQFITLGKGDATPASAIAPRFNVIRTQADYDAFKTQTQLLNGVTVDFAVNEVIVIFDEYRNSSGFLIAVKSISKSDNKLTVEVQASKGSDNVMTVNTQPFHAVRLQKTGLPVVFKENAPL